MFFSIWRVKKPYGSLNCREEGREKPVSIPCDCFLLFSAVEHVFEASSLVTSVRTSRKRGVFV